MRAARLVGIRPSFALYLVGLLLLPVKWLSPFSHAQAGWTDALFAAAAVAWAAEWVLGSRQLRLRPVHLALGMYVVFVLVSGIVTSEPRGTAAQNVLISAELGFLMLMTADFAQTLGARRLIVRTILMVVAVTGVECAVGLVLFYAGAHSSLFAPYSSYFKSSNLYTRIAAGFFSPPLLGSFCIFASGVIALPDGGLQKRTTVAAQIALAVIVLLTISRAIIGLAVAMVVRAGLANRFPHGRRVALVASVVGTIAIVALTTLPLSIDPLRPASTVATINPRLDAVEHSAQTLPRHLIFGVGPGALTGVQLGAPSRAHLTPLNVAATTGLPALAALVVMVVLLWRQRRRPTNIAIWSGLLGLALDGLGQDIEHFRHVWLMLGLADADRQSDQTWEIRCGPKTPRISATRPIDRLPDRVPR
jgi:hypothetical protein